MFELSKTSPRFNLFITSSPTCAVLPPYATVTVFEPAVNVKETFAVVSRPAVLLLFVLKDCSQAFALVQLSTFRVLPRSPAYLAIQSGFVAAVVYSSSYFSLFLISVAPAAADAAFFAVESTARTTHSELPYVRKFAAVKKSEALLALGLLKIFTNLSSVSTRTSSSTGPHLRCAAIAPSVVETAGTTVVRSISLTLTPGET